MSVVNFAGVKSITIPEGSVKKITASGVVLWEKKGFTNLVPLSTEADGKTIYNNGLGYKDGYRVSSNGSEKELGTSTVTGYIPYKKGDILYIYPAFFGRNTENVVSFYDNSFTFLGQITDSGSKYGICDISFKTTLVGNVSKLDLSAVTVSGVENIAYVRINNYVYRIGSGSAMIITKNEEIIL